MARQRPVTPSREAFEAALMTLDGDGLRQTLREVVPRLGASAYARLCDALVEKAARCPGGSPSLGPDEEAIAEIEAFAQAATRIGFADPGEFDMYLRAGSEAFLSKSYVAAARIFRALFGPLSRADIDLGEEETLDEVLSVDLGACAGHFLVSVYMSAPAATRAPAVLAAIDEVCALEYLPQPLHLMEQTAVESLPGFADFLPQWRALLEDRRGDERRSRWDNEMDHRLREVVERLDGIAGLAGIARSSGRSADLYAWCDALVAAEDWESALAAYAEAAALVGDEFSRGRFLDGAARMAAKLGRSEMSAYFERAWRGAPSMVRLRRWLGTADTAEALRARAVEALDACPNEALRQRALLLALSAQLDAAALLLATASGPGWSACKHPGELLFFVFERLLAGPEASLAYEGALDEKTLASDIEAGHLPAPGIDALLIRARLTVEAVSEREVMHAAMRKAAEKRIEYVAAHKRRRRYAHAASLAWACATVDPSQECAGWFAAMRERYRRYPALQRALKQHP